MEIFKRNLTVLSGALIRHEEADQISKGLRISR